VHAERDAGAGQVGAGQEVDVACVDGAEQWSLDAEQWSLDGGAVASERFPLRPRSTVSRGLPPAEHGPRSTARKAPTLF